MKRDMDLVRQLLLEIEAKHDGTGRPVKVAIEARSHEEVTEHLFMLKEAGLISGRDASNLSGRDILVLRITWDGHEFLDAIRDQEIWDKTQEGMRKAGGFSLDLAKALAKGFIKKKVEQLTGVGIDL